MNPHRARRASGNALPCTNTYSIAAIDPRCGCLGSAAASCALAVGSIVPHIRQGVGVVNTQHCGNGRMAEEMLDRMEGGMEPREALKEGLSRDDDPESRQFIVIAPDGRKAVWTGARCETPNAHMEGSDCVAAGNRLVSIAVIDAMVAAFEEARNPLFAERLLAALEAGRMQGGDSLGHESAVLVVVPRRTSEIWPANMIDLRVDHHADPVRELRRLYGIFAERNKGYADEDRAAKR